MLANLMDLPLCRGNVLKRVEGVRSPGFAGILPDAARRPTKAVSGPEEPLVTAGVSVKPARLRNPITEVSRDENHDLQGARRRLRSKAIR
jgi:hypothetical protein